MKPRLWYGLSVACFAVLALAGADASRADQNDALDIVNAKVAPADAVSAAEAQLGGRASKAEFVRAPSGWIYDVEIVMGNTVKDVHVDANTGVVLSAHDDEIDQDDQEDVSD